eukprot:4818763-Alexandrium_andersonii.AAC.1
MRRCLHQAFFLVLPCPRRDRHSAGFAQLAMAPRASAKASAKATAAKKAAAKTGAGASKRARAVDAKAEPGQKKLQ